MPCTMRRIEKHASKTLAGSRIPHTKGCGGARMVTASMVYLFTPTLVKHSTSYSVLSLTDSR